MGQLLDIDTWRESLGKAISELGSDVAQLLPNLVGALLILAVGWLLARASEAAASRILRAVGLDRASTRLGLADLLERAGILMTASQLSSRLIYWLMLLMFLWSSVETLGLSAVTTTLDAVLAFVPRLLGAVVIAVAGLLLGRLVATLVSSAAAASGMSNPPRLGFLAQSAVVGLVLVLAAEQVGIETSVLVIPLSVLLGCAGLAAGMTFALGARPVVTHIMAGHYLKKSLPRETSIEIEGRRGSIERVGTVDTLLRTDETLWTVPNAHLLEIVVVR